MSVRLLLRLTGAAYGRLLVAACAGEGFFPIPPKPPTPSPARFYPGNIRYGSFAPKNKRRLDTFLYRQI